MKILFITILLAIYNVIPYETTVSEWSHALDVGLTKSEKIKILKMHNEYRSRVAQGLVAGLPKAAFMQPLRWSNELAATAQQWANKCPSVPHDNYKDRIGSSNFTYPIQNTQRCNTHMKPKCGYIGMEAFFNEYPHYDIENKKCKPGLECQHFTQLVWADTQVVGCGFNRCGNDAKLGFFVCNYGEGGNVNETAAYKADTESCNECPKELNKCYKGLCVSDGLISNVQPECSVTQSKCKGTYANCHCSCQDGKAGPNCNLDCADNPIYTQYGMCLTYKNAGYCDNRDYWGALKKACPVTCGLCGNKWMAVPYDASITVELN